MQYFIFDSQKEEDVAAISTVNVVDFRKITGHTENTKKREQNEQIDHSHICVCAGASNKKKK